MENKIPPVFQMCHKEKKPDLIFSCDKGARFPPHFVIPLIPETNTINDKYYLPININSKYEEAIIHKTGISGELFMLEHDEIDETLRFGLESYLLNDESTPLSYVGEHEDFVKPFEHFIKLIPLDLKEMDRLYLEKRVSFVGLTPVFGKKREF